MDQNNLLTLLKPETTAINQVLRDDLKSVSNKKLAEVLEYAIFNGGKRIRPLLCLLTYRMANNSRSDKQQDKAELSSLPAQTKLMLLRYKGIYRLAMAFEYLHVASLLHDDVIDHADTRRGRPAANKVWGTTPVILAGDYLHSRAMAIAGSSNKTAILAAISGSTAAMVESEFIQMESVEKQDRTEKSYFKVLQGKTAALIAAACKTGALYSEQETAKISALNLFGNNLGLAFQITDDRLDYLGDPQLTGKAVGNDFEEGKMTLPLIYTLENCSTAEQDTINTLLNNSPKERQQDLTKVQTIIDNTGGFTYARKKAEALIKEAIEGLNIFADTQEKNVLLALGQYVLHREK